jgi:hypothetical protein
MSISPKSTASKAATAATPARPRKAMRPPDPRVPFTETGFSQCRFIVDESQWPVLCCGEPTVAGKSWCSAHWKIVYVKPLERQRR